MAKHAKKSDHLQLVDWPLTATVEIPLPLLGAAMTTVQITARLTTPPAIVAPPTAVIDRILLADHTVPTALSLDSAQKQQALGLIVL